MEFCTVDSKNLAQAAEIHAISWRESHKAFCAAEFVSQHTTLRQTEYLRQEMSAGKQLYMLIDGHPVGIVSIDGDVIENLYVLPSEKRKGYGTRLLQFAVEHCTGIPVLWVLSNNKAAYALYRKYGFQETENRKQLRDDLYEIEMKLKSKTLEP